MNFFVFLQSEIKKITLMKKIFVIWAVLLTTVTMQAQHEEGTATVQAKAGANWSWLTDYNKAKFGYNFGVEFEYYMTEQFSLSGAIMYSDQGGCDNQADKVVFDIDFVNVPVMLNFYVAPEVIPGLAVKAGVQPGFRAKTTIKSAGLKIDVDAFLKEYFGTNSDLRKVMFSVPVGLAYEYKNIVFDARYIFGLTDLINDDEKFRNNVLQLTLGYKFDAAF